MNLSFEQRRRMEGFFFVLPGIIVVLAVLGYPLVYNIVHNTLAPCGSTEQMSPHTLRHSFASAMLSDGAGLESVKELLGHSSLAATQIYTHVTLSELQHNYKLAHPRAQRKE